MSFDSSRSANSLSKPKRSCDSNSNPSNSSRNYGSRKKSKRNSGGQKTLGAAWGATSLSSSRSSSFRSSPFSDFGSYMVEKNRKLHHQFDAEALSSEKPIFHGVSIFVDGFTIPSSQDLRGYMLKYGGSFENYFSRRHVTHIICSNLPDSKIKNLRSFSRGLPVVKPTWIVDSVTANKLLNWVSYQLDQLADTQPKLSAFFAPRSKEAVGTTTSQLKTRRDDPSLKGVMPEDENSSEVGEPMEQRRQVLDEFDGVGHQTMTATITKMAISNDADVREEEPSDLNAEQKADVHNELQSSFHESSASVRGTCSDNRTNTDLSTSSVVGPSRRHRSTLEDPNFVENYFKNSRLHFIGTWRSRYRKRFPSSFNGFKGIGSGQNILESARKSAIIHIDMDCFFVSVVIRNRPELWEKPVAVCHSDNPKGTAEISSANYPARAYGVTAGMFVRDAKSLCPHLVIVPYNFEAYEEVADQFYDILHKHCNKVQAVSCDEAFLDVTDLEGEDPEILASTIRKEIFETTGCSASAGVAQNMLMARLATRTAKPAGQFYIPAQKVDDYLDQLPISALPGIGYVLEQKLKRLNIQTCGQLRMISKDSLQKDFGVKTGEMLWNHSRGLDHRLVGVIQESKSIGAEVNWGVRFKDQQDTQDFLLSLCNEVSLRLQGCGVLGRTFTLKVKKRRKDAEEPVKYMGCGDCENLSRSTTVPIATGDVEVLQRIAKQLLGSFHLDVQDIRGLGLQVSKLESADVSKKGLEKTSLKSWITSASTGTEEKSSISGVVKHMASSDREGEGCAAVSGQSSADPVEISAQMDNKSSNSGSQVSSLPPLCHLDIGVIESLPPELLSELNETYGGQLIEFIKRGRGKYDTDSNSSHVFPRGPTKVAMVKGKKTLVSDLRIPNKHHASQEHRPDSISNAGTSNEGIRSSGLEMADLMPSSFSQVDTSVLKELPDELRDDILEVLQAHRKQGSHSDASLATCTGREKELLDIGETENTSGCVYSHLDDNLWVGNPPLWVDKFKAGKSWILKGFAKIYSKSRSSEILSSILQRTVLESLDSQDASSDGWDEAVHNFCELLRQYIKLKIEVDIEEIYICFRLLRRLSTRSNFFLQVYDIVFPYLQASVGENYGGNLHVS